MKTKTNRRIPTERHITKEYITNEKAHSLLLKEQINRIDLFGIT